MQKEKAEKAEKGAAMRQHSESKKEAREVVREEIIAQKTIERHEEKAKLEAEAAKV